MPVEGRDLSSRQTQYVVKDLEIGQPINSDKCSETADGVARKSKGVKSCPRERCQMAQATAPLFDSTINVVSSAAGHFRYSLNFGHIAAPH